MARQQPEFPPGSYVARYGWKVAVLLAIFAICALVVALVIVMNPQGNHSATVGGMAVCLVIAVLLGMLAIREGRRARHGMATLAVLPDGVCLMDETLGATGMLTVPWREISAVAVFNMMIWSKPTDGEMAGTKGAWTGHQSLGLLGAPAQARPPEQARNLAAWQGEPAGQEASGNPPLLAFRDISHCRFERAALEKAVARFAPNVQVVQTPDLSQLLRRGRTDAPDVAVSEDLLVRLGGQAGQGRQSPAGRQATILGSETPAGPQPTAAPQPYGADGGQHRYRPDQQQAPGAAAGRHSGAVPPQPDPQSRPGFFPPPGGHQRTVGWEAAGFDDSAGEWGPAPQQPGGVTGQQTPVDWDAPQPIVEFPDPVPEEEAPEPVPTPETVWPASEQEVEFSDPVDWDGPQPVVAFEDLPPAEPVEPDPVQAAPGTGSQGAEPYGVAPQGAGPQRGMGPQGAGPPGMGQQQGMGRQGIGRHGAGPQQGMGPQSMGPQGTPPQGGPQAQGPQARRSQPAPGSDPYGLGRQAPPPPAEESDEPQERLTAPGAVSPLSRPRPEYEIAEDAPTDWDS